MEDPLNISIPLAGVDATIPLLPEGNYQCQIKESTCEPNKDKTGFNWNLKLGTASSATATDGRAVPPDHALFMTIGLQPAADTKDPEGFKRNLCNTVDAILGTNMSNRPDFAKEVVQNAIGKLVTASVYIDEWQGNKNNKVRRLVVQAQSPL